jgi:hypothetical protein
LALTICITPLYSWGFYAARFVREKTGKGSKQKLMGHLRMLRTSQVAYVAWLEILHMPLRRFRVEEL